jgi:hypothetical protein
MRALHILAATAAVTAAGVLPATMTVATSAPAASSATSRITSATKVAGDIDGDGKSDLVIGEDHAITVVYTSAAPGGSHTQKIPLPAGSLEFASAYGEQNVAVGDFNGDGYADVAAGVTTPHHDDGEIFVWYGGRNGLVPAHVVTLHGPKGKRDGFGGSLLAGALNKGPDQDLLVTDTTGVDGRTDRDVTELFGRAHGLSTAHETVLTIPNLVSAAIGDVNADGFPDLVYATTAPYRVSLILGTSSGLSLAHRKTVTGLHTHGQEVSRVAVGKVGSGKYPTVVISTPGATVAGKHNAGELIAVTGDKTGIETSHRQIISQATAGVPGVPTHDANFGSEITLADVNGDGHLDLITANSPEVKNPVGAIFVIDGAKHGFTGQGAQTLTEATSGLTVSPAADPHYFGETVIGFRPDGGSYASVAVGLPGGNAVDVFPGSAQGLTTSGASQIVGTPQDDFGESLAH